MSLGKRLKSCWRKETESPPHAPLTMRKIPYRVCQVASILVLAGWIFAMTAPEHGHPGGIIILYPPWINLMWCIGTLGMISGLVSVALGQRLNRATAFIALDLVLVLLPFFIPILFRNR